jgi:hypothetical protein
MTTTTGQAMAGQVGGATWTPREVAERCEALGARVELKGTKYRVYGPDGGQPVFFNAQRETNGSHLPNVLRDLRRNGLDLLEAERDAQERRSARPPEPLTQQLPAEALERVASSPAAQRRYGTTPSMATNDRSITVASPKDVPRIPFDARREMAELRDMVRKQGDDALEMLAAAERRIADLEGEVAELRAGSNQLRGPSMSELVRRVVWQWFLEHPGQKTTPQVLEMNIAEELPEGHGKTMVAAGCRDLVAAGRLQGGGTKTGTAPTRGVYWFDPAADTQPGQDV